MIAPRSTPRIRRAAIFLARLKVLLFLLSRSIDAGSQRCSNIILDPCARSKPKNPLIQVGDGPARERVRRSRLRRVAKPGKHWRLKSGISESSCLSPNPAAFGYNVAVGSHLEQVGG
jgi:hypothetical protein